GGAEDPERAAGAVELVRNAFVVDPPDPLDIWWEVLESVLELAAADEAEWYLGGRAGRGDDRLDSVERDQLADEQARERLARGPAGTEKPFLRADEADLDAFRRQPGQLGEADGVRAGIRDHDVGCAQGPAVDRREHAGRKRAGLEAGAVVDEGVGQRDEGVEDDRSATGGPSRGGQVELTRVADDDDVEVDSRFPEEAELGRSQPRRGARARLPALAAPVPD